MTELLNIIQFLVGLAAIIKGADWLTDGAASVAHRFGIPTIVVGLTIVAMGSSMPEFVVSAVPSAQGNADMALGNVVGSNIFNILGIIGITAMVTPIHVERGSILYDVPFVVLSSVFIVITAFDDFFGNNGGNSISRTDGLLMLCTFLVFMSYTMSIAKNRAAVADDAAERQPVWKAVALIVVGLAALIAGGNWLVDGASGIARLLGVSDSVIALTIVSAGTSAPELAASLMAARKGDTAMALGNVVGSVVFNVFFVLGSAAVICPLGIGGVTDIDILTLLAASFIMWFFCIVGKTTLTITRGEGLIMTVMAIMYYTLLVLKA